MVCCLTAVRRHDHFADGTSVIGFQVQRCWVRNGVWQYVVHVELIFFQYEFLQQPLDVRSLVRIAVDHGIAASKQDNEFNNVHNVRVGIQHLSALCSVNNYLLDGRERNLYGVRVTGLSLLSTISINRVLVYKQ